MHAIGCLKALQREHDAKPNGPSRCTHDCVDAPLLSAVFQRSERTTLCRSGPYNEGPFRRWRTREGPERRGKSGKPTAHVASDSDSGQRHRRPRRTSRSNMPRTHSNSNVGTHVPRANRHRIACPDNTNDQHGIPDHESNETQRLLTPPRTAPRTDQMRGRGVMCLAHEQAMEPYDHPATLQTMTRWGALRWTDYP